MTHKARKNGDDALVLALASGQTSRKAAAACGLHERTVRRRLKDADFRARVNEARDFMAAAALGRLSRTMTRAADCLRKLLASPSDAVRLGAARSVLELQGRLTDLLDTRRRLTEVEKFMAEVQNGQSAKAA